MSKSSCSCSNPGSCSKSDSSPNTMDKWRYTLWTTLVFVILVNPYTYKFTQKMLGGILGNISNASGCPTTMGIGLHAIVFTLIVRYMMGFDI